VSKKEGWIVAMMLIVGVDKFKDFITAPSVPEEYGGIVED